MKRIRKGKDIHFTWKISTNGEPESLEGRDLTLFINCSPMGSIKVENLNISGNEISFTYHGKDQKWLGIYSITLWENYNKVGQTVVDKMKAFELVANTDLECC